MPSALFKGAHYPRPSSSGVAAFAMARWAASTDARGRLHPSVGFLELDLQLSGQCAHEGLAELLCIADGRATNKRKIRWRHARRPNLRWDILQQRCGINRLVALPARD